MSDRDLRALRAADGEWSQAILSRSADARIRTRLTAPEKRAGRLVPAIAFGAGLTIALSWASLRTPSDRAVAPREAGGFAVTEAPCSLLTENTALAASGRCSLDLAEHRLSIESSRPIRFERTTDGVRLLEGEALFHVRPQPSVVRIHVSGGTIEVHGTRFIVVENGGRGHVDLLEGEISFRDRQDHLEKVVPGRRYVWSEAPPPRESEPPAVAPPSKIRATAPPPPSAESDKTEGPSLDQRLMEVQRLRGEARYSEAAAELRALLEGPFPAWEREVVSFELGRILEGPLRDRRAACVHWKDHAETFAGGTYEAEVKRAVARCSTK